MKKSFIFLLLSFLWFSGSAQFVARMQVKEDIPGICNKNEVYALLPSMKGQVQAICPVSKDSIRNRLNSEVAFLKDQPDYSDKGMISIIINCNGDVVQCKMDNKTKSTELDRQIEAVFNSLGTWKAGKLKKKNVDTVRLFSFKIDHGKFSLQ